MESFILSCHRKKRKPDGSPERYRTNGNPSELRKKWRGYKIGRYIDQKCVLFSGQRRRLTEFLMLEIFSRIQKGRALLGLYPFNLFWIGFDSI